MSLVDRLWRQAVTDRLLEGYAYADLSITSTTASKEGDSVAPSISLMTTWWNKHPILLTMEWPHDILASCGRPGYSAVRPNQ